MFPLLGEGDIIEELRLTMNQNLSSQIPYSGRRGGECAAHPAQCFIG